MQRLNTKRRQLFLAITAASLGICQIASAQESQTIEVPKVELLPIEAPVIEEMLVTGRQQSAAQSVVTERLEEAFAADLMSSDQISRTGDSNVAVALTRVTGVTLLDGKYVYVRSLGERYSSTTLNGAAVPSPELTRNVLPLDLIPSSIVESLKVQKAYSPELWWRCGRHPHQGCTERISFQSFTWFRHEYRERRRPDARQPWRDAQHANGNTQCTESLSGKSQ